MQSILTIAPKKGAALEVSNGKTNAVTAENVDNKSDDNKASPRFAEVLGTLIKKKQEASEPKQLKGDLGEKTIAEAEEDESKSSNSKSLANVSVDIEKKALASTEASLQKNEPSKTEKQDLVKPSKQVDSDKVNVKTESTLQEENKTLVNKVANEKDEQPVSKSATAELNLVSLKKQSNNDSQSSPKKLNKDTHIEVTKEAPKGNTVDLINKMPHVEDESLPQFSSDNTNNKVLNNIANSTVEEESADALVNKLDKEAEPETLHLNQGKNEALATKASRSEIVVNDALANKQLNSEAETTEPVSNNNSLNKDPNSEIDLSEPQKNNLVFNKQSSDELDDTQQITNGTTSNISNTEELPEQLESELKQSEQVLNNTVSNKHANAETKGAESSVNEGLLNKQESSAVEQSVNNVFLDKKSNNELEHAEQATNELEQSGQLTTGPVSNNQATSEVDRSPLASNSATLGNQSKHKVDSSLDSEEAELQLAKGVANENESLEIDLNETLDTQKSSKQLISDIVLAMQETSAAGEVKENNKSTDKDELMLSDEQATPLPETLSPILAQIETAQKTDTKVTEPKVLFEKPDVSLKESKKVDAKGEKSANLNVDNLLSDDSVSTDDKVLKELTPQATKIDQILSTLKQDVDKPVFSLNHETPSLRATAATVADRILNQAASNTPLMQSTALQQPVDLQSKQASVIMGERIMMMLNQGKQEVTIRLDPAELGSMQIKLQVQHEQLQVAIQTQVGQSRDIIEQNLPRLREQLAQQGINLGEASVEQQSRQQEQSNPNQSQNSGSSLQATGRGAEALVDDQSEWLATQMPLPAQGIDYYA